jgi:hypothetical protein
VTCSSKPLRGCSIRSLGQRFPPKIPKVRMSSDKSCLILHVWYENLSNSHPHLKVWHFLVGAALIVALIADLGLVLTRSDFDPPHIPMRPKSSQATSVVPCRSSSDPNDPPAFWPSRAMQLERFGKTLYHYLEPNVRKVAGWQLLRMNKQINFKCFGNLPTGLKDLDKRKIASV